MFFKQTLQNRAINKIKVDRDVLFMPMMSVKKLGFLFPLHNHEMDNTINSFVELLSSKGIDYKGLGILSAKKMKQEITFGDRVFFVNKSNLNYYDLPDFTCIQPLIDYNCDLFIDFHPNYNFTQHYISLLTNATFRVGRFNCQNTPYDLVIESGSDSNSDIYIEQVIHYLSSIKPA